MPYRITFVTALFNGEKDRELSHKMLAILLNALYECNCEWLKAHPETPGIYDCKVGGKPLIHYQREPIGQEDWQDIPTTIQLGYGDCEDLACWRAAELTVRNGIAARPVFKYKIMPDGNYLYHILVRYPDGTIEDPSKKLGMGKHLFG